MTVLRYVAKATSPSYWTNNVRHYSKQWARNNAIARFVKRDPVTGMLYENVFGGRVFTKAVDDYRSEASYERLCRDIYFKHYLPKPGDTVVDIGLGYGHEALFAHSMSPGVRYIGVEAQPSVYECLANTLAPYRPKLMATPLAIADTESVWLSSASNYEVAGTSGGCVEIPAIGWKAFCKRYDVNRVALLKVNIEGGEKPLLPCIGDMSMIDRVVMGTHDFLADQTGQEHYRTDAFVTDYLKRQGFKINRFPEVPPLGWLYAER